MGSVYLYLISFDFFYFLFQYEIFKHLLLGKEKTTKILILKQKYLEHSNRVLFSKFGKSAQFLVWIFFPSFFCLGACGFVLWTLVWIFIRLYYSALIVTEDNLMLFLFMREVIIMVLILLFCLYLVDLLPLFLIN